MRTCSNCGATVREGAKFCTSCGTRLNDSATTSQHDTWAATPNNDTAAANQTASSDGPTPPVGEGAGVGTEATTGQPLEASSESTTTGTGEGFSWSWGAASPGVQASSEEATAQVDEESGTVLDEGRATDADTPEIADATEVEILEDQPATSEEELTVDAHKDEAAPETATPGPDEGDATLAAWAGQWSDEDRAEPTPLRATGDTTPDEGKEPASDADEDTVEKAERLIAELRRIIPSLARPKPIDPNARSEGHTVLVGGRKPLPEIAAELDAARSGEQFDDLRETIDTARKNPRDVDTMLSLAGQAERLMALLDDRDRMASKLEALASRLRETVTGDNDGDAGDGPNLKKML